MAENPTSGEPLAEETDHQLDGCGEIDFAFTEDAVEDPPTDTSARAQDTDSNQPRDRLEFLKQMVPPIDMLPPDVTENTESSKDRQEMDQPKYPERHISGQTEGEAIPVDSNSIALPLRDEEAAQIDGDPDVGSEIIGEGPVSSNTVEDSLPDTTESGEPREWTPATSDAEIPTDPEVGLIKQASQSLIPVDFSKDLVEAMNFLPDETQKNEDPESGSGLQQSPLDDIAPVQYENCIIGTSEDAKELEQSADPLTTCTGLQDPEVEPLAATGGNLQTTGPSDVENNELEDTNQADPLKPADEANTPIDPETGVPILQLDPATSDPDVSDDTKEGSLTAQPTHLELPECTDVDRIQSHRLIDDSLFHKELQNAEDPEVGSSTHEGDKEELPAPVDADGHKREEACAEPPKDPEFSKDPEVGLPVTDVDNFETAQAVDVEQPIKFTANLQLELEIPGIPENPETGSITYNVGSVMKPIPGDAGEFQLDNPCTAEDNPEEQGSGSLPVDSSQDFSSITDEHTIEEASKDAREEVLENPDEAGSTSIDIMDLPPPADFILAAIDSSDYECSPDSFMESASIETVRFLGHLEDHDPVSATQDSDVLTGDGGDTRSGRRRRCNSFVFQHSSEGDREEESAPLGSITDILDGVVFSPAGSELPRPSPDFRSRSNLSSFRGEDHHPTSPAKENDSAGPLPEAPLEEDIQPVEKEVDQHTVTQYSQVVRELSCRAKSALPPLPTEAKLQNSGQDDLVDTNIDVKEFDNPLYEVLSDCRTGPTLPDTKTIYVQVDESLFGGEPHYRTTVSGTPLDSLLEPKGETLYARVAGEESDDELLCPEVKPLHRVYQNCDVEEQEEDDIYENVEDLQQTYANIPTPDSSLSKPNILSALILDVNNPKTGETAESSSGNSSLPSPELSPTDSLINSSAAASRAASRSPDSGVFVVGLLSKVDSAESDVIVPELKEDISLQLSETLMKFELLEEESKNLLEHSDPVKKAKSRSLKKEKKTTKYRKVKVVKTRKESNPKKLAAMEDMMDVVCFAEGVKPSDDGSPLTFDLADVPPELPKSPMPGDGIFKADIVTVMSEPSSLASVENDSTTEENVTKDVLPILTDLHVNIPTTPTFTKMEKENSMDELTKLTTPKPSEEGPQTPPVKTENPVKTKSPRSPLGGIASITPRPWKAPSLSSGEKKLAYSPRSEESADQPSEPSDPPQSFATEMELAGPATEPSLEYTSEYIEVGSIVMEEPRQSASVKTQYIYGFETIVTETVSTVDNKISSSSLSFPATYFDSALDSGDFIQSDNPQETLIEREIRLQKEREEALALERQTALLNSQNTKSTPMTTLDNPERKLLSVDVKDHEDQIHGGGFVSPAEARISEEIREFRQREDELRKLRLKNATLTAAALDESENLASIATTDEGHYSDPERDVNSDSNSSRVESPETPCVPTEFPQFSHQRTQSMDSMSSGHSSGDHNIHHGDFPAASINPKNGRRNVLVKPLDEPQDEEETPAYRRISKETPIERDIRLAREREEALRREKGLPSWTVAPHKNNDKETRFGNRLFVTDKRDVQHRLATSRIQQEIDETAEREKELQSAGKIQTTSEERVDSKVTRLSHLAEYSAENETLKERRTNLSKSVSTPHLDQTGYEPSLLPPPDTPRSINNEEEMPFRAAKTVTRAAAPAVNSGNGVARKFSGAGNVQRGLMEKFIASRGKLNSQAAFNVVGVAPGSSAGDSGGAFAASAIAAPVKMARHPVPPVNPVPVQLGPSNPPNDNVSETKATPRAAPLRRTYATAEEKIQEELREMKQREEELRASRMKLFAKSQPNLLQLFHDQDDSSSKPTRPQSRLLDSPSEETGATPPPPPSSGDVPAKGLRRRSALIAQWENLIQQTNN